MANMQSLMESWRRYGGRLDEVLQERSVMKEKYPYKAIYVVGPSGAGKIYLGGKIGIPSEFITANTDARVENVFKAYDIPLTFSTDKGSDEDRLQQNMRTMLQNAQGGHVTNLVLKGSPLLFDTTGEDPTKISGRASRLVEMGYDVAIFQIVVPPQVSIARDRERGEEGGRSVGAARVEKINTDYQDAVVTGKGYSVNAAKINKAAGGNFVTILAGDVVPNIYALDSFGKFKAGDLTVSKEDAAAVGNPSFAKVQGMIKDATAGLKVFLSNQVNPKGAAILAGQKALINAVGGEKLIDSEGNKVAGFTRGQSVTDLWAVRGTKWAMIPQVTAALAAMGGDPGEQVKAAVRKTNKELPHRGPGDPKTARDTLDGKPVPKMSKYQARGSDKYDLEKGYTGQGTASAMRNPRNKNKG